MARGLILSSISASSLPISCAVSFISPHRTPHPSRAFTRFFCKCAQEERSLTTSDYKEFFANRMARAGLKPHHRIALAVSGGPDSMALCVLAADWKVNGLDSNRRERHFIDGLVALIVDHGLRPESGEEANIVSQRVSKMGIRCEITRCEWKDGRPERGDLQEAAREMRYELFHKVCMRQQFGVLLLAHHADDQAELLILRLSRNSGVLGLAGMAFTSQFFSKHAYFPGEGLMNQGILLVRPFLDFSKKDMYKICQENEQNWVEDPSNRSPLFARSRIRMSLRKFSSSFFSSEIRALITACRTTRMYVDRVCSDLISEVVTVMEQGYAVIDLESLNASQLDDICLTKFIANVTKFISQRQRHVRGSTSKLLLDYICTSPCKTSLTAAGCYLCPAPGSKGTKILVCCSVNCPTPSNVELMCSGGHAEVIAHELEEIMAGIGAGSKFSDAEASNVHFISVPARSVLEEAKRLNLISESTYRSVLMLQEEETNRFRVNSDEKPDYQPKHSIKSVSTSCQHLQPGQVGYFMNRFLISWKPSNEYSHQEFSCGKTSSTVDLAVDGMNYRCRFCELGHDMVAKVRPMMESDWLCLAKLSNCQSGNKSDPYFVVSLSEADQASGKATCLDHVRLSAQRALTLLKSIPVAARRSLPVLVDSNGLLLSIPGLAFTRCPCLEITARFQPRVPVGGGQCSFY